MARIRNGLFSAQASGTVGNMLTYAKTKGVGICKGNRLMRSTSGRARIGYYGYGLYGNGIYCVVPFFMIQADVVSDSPGQIAQRAKYKAGITAWNLLTVEEKEVYKVAAENAGKNTVAYFMEQYLA